MAELAFTVDDWLGAAIGPPEVRNTLASLRVTAGDPATQITEVEDLIARTVRPHVRVPLVSLAEWLLMNWWRLRWESRPVMPKYGWYEAHCLSTISSDTPWPPLEISSDGEFIHLRMDAEASSDATAIRYLRSIRAEVQAAEFEAAVERFVDTVEGRLSAVGCAYRELAEMRQELVDERSRATVAQDCRWQALAGIDPGEAPQSWLTQAHALADDTGSASGDEVMSCLSDLDGGLDAASRILSAMRASATAVDLSWVTPDPKLRAPTSERPWQKGARLAQTIREQCDLGGGPIDNDTLSKLIGAPVPLQGHLAREVALGGGLRNGASDARTHVLVPSRRVESQRFFLVRLIGAAHVFDKTEHLLPVTRAETALQKLERSFAQELLCPWAALDEFTDDRGLDDEAIADAADHFEVSEWLVRTALVNRGKMPRSHLPRQLR